MVSMSNPSTIVGILNRDYRRISVTIQIPNDAGLVPIPYTGQKIAHTWDRTSTAFRGKSSKYALNRVTTVRKNVRFICVAIIGLNKIFLFILIIIT